MFSLFQKAFQQKWFQSMPFKSKRLALPWWHSGQESACQCRGHGFNSWFGRIPQAVEQLSPCATLLSLLAATTEACVPTTCAPQIEQPPLCNQKVAPDVHNQRKPAHSNRDPTQPNYKNKVNRCKFKKEKSLCLKFKKPTFDYTSKFVSVYTSYYSNTNVIFLTNHF